MLTVTTDGSGVVRRAIVAPEDTGRVTGNMRLRVFSERAVRAVMDPNCANLPLPPRCWGRRECSPSDSDREKGSDMTGLPMLPLGRRSLLAGAAGSAALFAAPAAVRAQALAPPQAGPEAAAGAR